MIPRRRLLLGAALAATLGATWWAASLEQEDVETPAHPRVEASHPLRPAAAAAGASLAALDAPRAALPELRGFLQSRSLQPPPPPPPPAPKPQAPPLPFHFVGALEEDGGRAVFLLEGNQVHMARPGDKLGSQYRVERVTSTSIEFTYLPLQQRQTLATTRP